MKDLNECTVQDVVDHFDGDELLEYIDDYDIQHYAEHDLDMVKEDEIEVVVDEIQETEA